jgi:hypothetical protein
MNPLDLVIVTIFLIIVFYALTKAWNSLADQAKIEVDSKSIEQQLEQKQFNGIPLKDIVKISFKLEKRYKYNVDNVAEDQFPRSLALNVENISDKLADKLNSPQTAQQDAASTANRSSSNRGATPTQPSSSASAPEIYAPEIYVYVVWDRSTLTDHENESRRVIHLDDNKQLTDRVPPKTQVDSPVSPGTKFSGNLTAEELLKPDEAKVYLEPTTPILNLSKIKATSKIKKVPKARREQLEKKLASFEDRRKTLEFSLLLMLRLVDFADSATAEAYYPIRCKFTATSMPRYDQLPWNPKP